VKNGSALSELHHQHQQHQPQSLNPSTPDDGLYDPVELFHGEFHFFVSDGADCDGVGAPEAAGEVEEGDDGFNLQTPIHPNLPFQLEHFETFVGNDTYRIDGPLDGRQGLFKGQHIPSAEPVVFKVCRDDPSRPDLADREWVHHLAVQYDGGAYHSHVVRLYAVYQVTSGFFESYLGCDKPVDFDYTRVMVLQRADRGDLSSCRRLVPALTALAHAACALHHLHTAHLNYKRVVEGSPLSRLYTVGSPMPQLLHNDVKPANLLVCTSESDEDEDLIWTVVLGDFGGVSFVGEQRRGMYTPRYAAPEVVAHQVFSQEADIFGLAASVAFVANINGIAACVGRARVQRSIVSSRFAAAGLSADVVDRLMTALAREPERRPDTLVGLV
jgi:serine/threonine protein kinase